MDFLSFLSSREKINIDSAEFLQKYCVDDNSVPQGIREKFSFISISKKDFAKQIKNLDTIERRIEAENILQINTDLTQNDLKIFDFYETSENEEYRKLSPKCVLVIGMQKLIKLSLSLSKIFQNECELKELDILKAMPKVIRFFPKVTSDQNAYMDTLSGQISFLTDKMDRFFDSQEHKESQEFVFEIISALREMHKTTKNNKLPELMNNMLNSILECSPSPAFDDELFEKLTNIILNLDVSLEDSFRIAEKASIVSSHDNQAKQTSKALLFASGLSLIKEKNVKIPDNLITSILEAITKTINFLGGFLLNDTIEIQQLDEIPSPSDKTSFFERTKYFLMEETRPYEFDYSLKLLREHLSMIINGAANKSEIITRLLVHTASQEDINASIFNMLVYYIISILDNVGYDYNNDDIKMLLDRRLYEKHFSCIGRNAAFSILRNKLEKNDSYVLEMISTVIDNENVYHFMALFIPMIKHMNSTSFALNLAQSSLFEKLINLAKNDNIVFDYVAQVLYRFPKQCAVNETTNEFLLSQITLKHTEIIKKIIENTLLHLSIEDENAGLLIKIVKTLDSYERIYAVILVDSINKYAQTFKGSFVNELESIDVYKVLSKVALDKEMPIEVLQCLTVFMKNPEIAKKLTFMPVDDFMPLTKASPDVNCTKYFIEFALGDSDGKANEIKMMSAISLLLERSKQTNTQTEVMRELTRLAGISESNAGKEFAAGVFEYAVENFQKCTEENELLTESINLIKQLSKTQFSEKTFTTLINVLKDGKYNFPDEIFKLFNELVSVQSSYIPPFSFRFGRYGDRIFDNDVELEKGFCFATCLKLNPLEGSFDYPLAIFENDENKIMFYFTKGEGETAVLKSKINNEDCVFKNQFPINTWFSLAIKVSQSNIKLFVDKREVGTFNIKPLKYLSKFNVYIASFSNAQSSSLKCEMSPVVLYKQTVDPTNINFNIDPITFTDDISRNVIRMYVPRAAKGTELSYICNDLTKTALVRSVIVPQITKASKTLTKYNSLCNCIPTLCQLKEPGFARGGNMLVYFFKYFITAFKASDLLCKEFRRTDNFKTIGYLLCEIDLDYLSDELFTEAVELMETKLAAKAAPCLFLNYNLIFRLNNIEEFINNFAKVAYSKNNEAFFNREAFIPFLFGTYSEIKAGKRSMETIQCVLDFAYDILSNESFKCDKSFVASYAIFSDDLTTKKVAIKMMEKINSNQECYEHINSAEAFLPWVSLINTGDFEVQFQAIEKMLAYFNGDESKSEEATRAVLRAIILFNPPKEIDKLCESFRDRLIQNSETIPLMLKLFTCSTLSFQNENAKWLLNILENEPQIRNNFLKCKHWYIHLLDFCKKTQDLESYKYFCYIFKADFKDFNTVFKAIQLMGFDYTLDWRETQINIIKTLCSDQFLPQNVLSGNMKLILQQLAHLIFYNTIIFSGGRFNESAVQRPFRDRFQWLWDSPSVNVYKESDEQNNKELLKLALDLLPYFSGELVTVNEEKLEMILVFLDMFRIYAKIDSEDAEQYVPIIFDKMKGVTRGAMMLAAVNLKDILDKNGMKVPIDLLDYINPEIKPAEVIYGIFRSTNEIQGIIRTDLIRTRNMIVNYFKETIFLSSSNRQSTNNLVFDLFENADVESFDHYRIDYDASMKEINSEYIKEYSDNAIGFIKSDGRVWNNQGIAPHFIISSFVNRRGGKVLMDVSYAVQHSGNQINQAFSLPTQTESIDKEEKYVSSANSVGVKGIFNGSVVLTKQSIEFEGHALTCDTLFAQEILMTDIEFVFKRRYVLEDIACEIYSAFKPPLLLVLPTTQDRDTFMKRICSLYVPKLSRIPQVPETKFDIFRELRKCCSGICQNKTNNDLVNETGIVYLWVNMNISTYEYINYLNLFGGRSFNDFSIYPIMPWVINVYNVNLSSFLNRDDPYRDLSKTMLSLDSGVWQRLCDSISSSETNRLPQYGFINPAKCTLMMIRQDPFYQMMKDLQGRLEDRNRSFLSVDVLFQTSKAEGHHELTPEWFSFPRFLVNTNNYQLTNEGDKDDVKLPEWASTNLDNPLAKALRFIELNRAALESRIVSKTINQWFDLIYGINRTNQTTGNPFTTLVCPEYVPENEIERVQRRECASNILTCMNELFTKEHEKRAPESNEDMKIREEMDQEIEHFMKDLIFTVDGKVYSVEAPDPTNPQQEVLIKASTNQKKLVGVSSGHRIAVFINDKNEEESFATVLFLREGKRRIICHEAASVTSACVAGGRLLILGGEDGTVSIWSLPSLSLINVLSWHFTKIIKVACSADANLIVTLDCEKNMILQSIDGSFISSVPNVESPVDILVFKNGYIAVIEEHAISLYDCVGTFVARTEVEYSVIKAKKFVSDEYRNYIAIGCEKSKESFCIQLIDITTLKAVFKQESIGSASMFELNRKTMKLILAEGKKIFIYSINIKHELLDSNSY